MRAKAGLLWALLLTCAWLVPPAVHAQVVFSPPVWKFGSILKGEKIQITMTATNTGKEAVIVNLLPTCTCLTVTPAERTIAPGAAATFVLGYDSSDDTGITRKDFVIWSRPPGLAQRYYTLTGVVRDEKRGPAPAGGPSGSVDGRPGAVSSVTVTYYYTPGCRSCEQFLSTEIPRLSRQLGLTIVVVRKDVLQPSLFEELAGLAASRGDTVREIPALAVGSVLLQGDAAIRKGLAAALQAPASAQLIPPEANREFPAVRLAVLPVAVAGLIDGVNPCAFATLIFLLASLAVAGRGRREVLLIGAVFSASVFLTYLGIGLGLFAILRAASTVSIVSLLLRWVLVAFLVVFAGMSVYDYSLIRRGRSGEILLQLPTSLKKQIHSAIRARVRTATLAGSSLVLGFLVSIYEFACTGQVYVPVLTSLVRVGQDSAALGLLLLYNVCFIVPLLVVFGASYLGVSSGRITRFFQAHMGAVKLALAVVFAALAVFTLVG